MLDTKLTKNQNSETLAIASLIIGMFMGIIKAHEQNFERNEKNRLEEELKQKDLVLNKLKLVKKHNVSYKELVPYKKYFENLYYRAKTYVLKNKNAPSFKKYFDKESKVSSTNSNYDFYDFLNAESLCINEFIRYEDPDFFKQFSISSDL